MTQLQKPYNVTFSPNLSGLTIAGRNAPPTRITITNNDSRNIPEVRINVLRADLMPSAVMSDAAIVKAGAGETIITEKWVQAKLSTDVAFTPINDWDSPIAFTLDSLETKAFDVKLVIPDSIDVQGKISFSLLVSFLAVTEPKVTGISIDNTPLADIHPGETSVTVLTATVTGEAGADTSVTWSSSDENIFTIANDGTVTGVNPGRAIVKALSSNPAIYNGVYLTILPPEIISITIDNKPLSAVNANNPTPTILTATVVADIGADTSVTWSSSDENIFTIANDGTVTPITDGTATVTATSSNPLIFDSTNLSVIAEFIPILTGAIAWFDATDSSTLILDSMGRVAEWVDKTGNNNNAVKNTTQPLTGTINLNGRNVIQFRGDYMQMPLAVIPTGNTPYTICAVWHPTGNNQALIQLGGHNTNESVGIHTIDTDSIRQFWWNNDIDTNASWEPNLIIAKWDGTTRTTRINKVNNSDTPIGKNTTNAYSALGGIPTTGYMLYGYIAELIVYHRALTATEILQNETYFNTKWGLIKPASDMIAWYDASDISTITENNGNVSQWNDKSGNGYNATLHSIAPTTGTDNLNGKNVITFNNDWMNLPTDTIPVGNSSYTICAVWTTHYRRRTLVMLGNAPDSTSDYHKTMWIHDDDYYVQHRWFDDDLNSPANSAPDNTPLIGIFTFDESTNIRRNILAHTDVTDTPAAPRTATAEAARIGGTSSSNGAYNMNGDYIAELIIYHRALTDIEIDNTKKYLKNKWGI